MNRPNWYTIRTRRLGLSKWELCELWLDEALPVGRENSGLNRGVVLKELRTCTTALLKNKDIASAVASKLDRDDDPVGVDDALKVARQATRRTPITETSAVAAAAAVIEHYAWPLAKAVCETGEQALAQVRDRLKTRGCALPKAERDLLKDRAPQRARQQMDKENVFADPSKLQPGSPRWDERVKQVADQLIQEIALPSPPPPAKTAGPSPSGPPKPGPPLQQVQAQRKRLSEEQKQELLQSEEAKSLEELVDHAVEQVRSPRFVACDPERLRNLAIKVARDEAILDLLKKPSPDRRTEARVYGLVAHITRNRITDAYRKLRRISTREQFWEREEGQEPDSGEMARFGWQPEDSARVVLLQQALAEEAERIQDGSWEAERARELLLDVDLSTVGDDLRGAWKRQLIEAWLADGPSGPPNARAPSRAAAIDRTISLVEQAAAAALRPGGSA
ncbi:hypothetical protein ACWC3X_38415 [Streptomyces populi]